MISKRQYQGSKYKRIEEIGAIKIPYKVDNITQIRETNSASEIHNTTSHSHRHYIRREIP